MQEWGTDNLKYIEILIVDMVGELKEKIKTGIKIGAAIGLGFGVVFSVAAKPDEMGNLEFMLRGLGTTASSTAISSLSGAVISTMVHYKHKTLDYIHNKRLSGPYTDN